MLIVMWNYLNIFCALFIGEYVKAIRIKKKSLTPNHLSIYRHKTFYLEILSTFIQHFFDSINIKITDIT